MIRTLVSVAFLICLSDISYSQDVHQTQTDLIKFPGQSEELHCSHSSSLYNVMLWYKQTRAGSMELLGYLVGTSETVEDKFKKKLNIEGNANKNSVLKLQSLSSEDSAVYFCAARQGSRQAFFGEGTRLTVLDPDIEISKQEDINVTIIQPSEKEACKKKTVTLVCLAENFYPDHVSITWMVSGKNRTDGVATDPHAIKNGTGKKFTISSRLKVTKKEWNNAKNEFSCKLDFFNGNKTFPKEIKVFGIGGSGYTREDYVKSSQVVMLSYGVVIAKSGLYGLVIFVFVWRKGSHGK